MKTTPPDRLPQRKQSFSHRPHPRPQRSGDGVCVWQNSESLAQLSTPNRVPRSPPCTIWRERDYDVQRPSRRTRCSGTGRCNTPPNPFLHQRRQGREGATFHARPKTAPAFSGRSVRPTPSNRTPFAADHPRMQPKQAQTRNKPTTTAPRLPAREPPAGQSAQKSEATKRNIRKIAEKPTQPPKCGCLFQPFPV